MVARDGVGLAEAYAKYRSILIPRVARLVGDLNLAEDAVQEAFLRAWERRHTFRYADELYRWLYVVSRNYAWKAKKRSKHIVSMDNSAPTLALRTDGDNDVPDADRLVVWYALQSLSPEQRDVLLLRYDEGLTERQMSERLNCSVSAVKARLHRARAAFRRAFSE